MGNSPPPLSQKTPPQISLNYWYFQENMNALHLAAMSSKEDIVKMLLNRKGVDICAPGGVSKV